MTLPDSETLIRLLHEYIGTEAAEDHAWNQVKEAERCRAELTTKRTELGNQMALLVKGEPERTIRVLVGEQVYTIGYDECYSSNPVKISHHKLNLVLPL